MFVMSVYTGQVLVQKLLIILSNLILFITLSVD
jgi:hypothetical protein